MADELLSLRIIVVAPSLSDRAMFREAAAAARVPIELVENDGETAGARSIALIAGSIRLRLPSRVLLVDDSPTMRSIVRKVLAATRFPLQVTEAGEGAEALALARAVEFDLVFFDYNLPGLSGLEAIAELRRAERHADFVLMTSADGEALAEKAHAQGIAFLLSPSTRRIWKGCYAGSAACARSVLRQQSAIGATARRRIRRCERARRGFRRSARSLPHHRWK